MKLIKGNKISEQTFDPVEVLFDQLNVNRKFQKENPVEYMRGYLEGVIDYASGKVEVK